MRGLLTSDGLDCASGEMRVRRMESNRENREVPLRILLIKKAVHP